MLNLLSSHYSIGLSILTLEEPEEITLTKPISIFSIAKKHGLNEIFLVEKSFGGFFQSYKISNEIGVPLRFGIKMVVCNNINEKTEESLSTESKVIIWLKNSAAYKDAIKIYSKSFKDGFYYQNRIDWATLKEMWTENLGLSIPFYDSFLHSNLLIYNHRATPDFGRIEPNFLIENHNLPIDPLIKNAVDNYSKSDKIEKVDANTVYYYSRASFKAYMIFRTIHNRSTFNKPQLDGFTSDQFSFLRD